MAKDKDKEKSVEIMSPARAYVPPPNLLHAFETHDRLAAVEIVNSYVAGKVDKAKEKEKDKKKGGPNIPLFILLILVLSPIITALEWAIVTSIYNSIFK